MKQQYDEQVNSAEAYIAFLLDKNIVGVYNYAFLERDYKDWCANEGLIPLSIQTLKRSLTAQMTVDTTTMRDGGRVVRRLIFDNVEGPFTWEEGTGYGVKTPELPVLVENQRLGDGW
jgi:hypothetical protein